MRAEVADLPGNLRTMVGAFQMVPDPMARYKQLLFFASKLEGLEDSLKVEENKVQVSEHVFQSHAHSACAPTIHHARFCRAVLVKCG